MKGEKAMKIKIENVNVYVIKAPSNEERGNERKPHVTDCYIAVNTKDGIKKVYSKRANHASNDCVEADE